MLFSLANLDPLTPEVKIVGALLGTGAFFASVYLFWNHRRDRVGVEANAAGGFAISNAWRLAEALLTAMIGIALFLGVWIHPGQTPRVFLMVWLSTLTLVTLLLFLGGVDLLLVRRHAARERARLMEEGNSSLARRSSRTAPIHRTNTKQNQ